MANTILSMVWHDLGLDYLYRYADIINSVTVDDVQRVARAYLRPACTVLSIAGPQESSRVADRRGQHRDCACAHGCGRSRRPLPDTRSTRRAN
ncbi:MAG: hypothetical protein R3A10_13565 [Caldilineaceae bacterium]